MIPCSKKMFKLKYTFVIEIMTQKIYFLNY